MIGKKNPKATQNIHQIVPRAGEGLGCGSLGAPSSEQGPQNVAGRGCRGFSVLCVPRVPKSGGEVTLMDGSDSSERPRASPGTAASSRPGGGRIPVGARIPCLEPVRARSGASGNCPEPAWPQRGAVPVPVPVPSPLRCSKGKPGWDKHIQRCPGSAATSALSPCPHGGQGVPRGWHSPRHGPGCSSVGASGGGGTAGSWRRWLRLSRGVERL